jgi:hypothetical protein
MNVFELFGSEKPRKNLKESSEITIVYESSDMCKVCGQTPCNCTNISESTVNEFAIDKNDAGDGRSKLIGAIAQLLQANKKVDFYVPGIRGHVSGIGGQGDWVTLKRWNKPHSKINYSLDLDSSDDNRFALKMIRPDYYQVVEKNELGEGIGSDTAKLLGIPVVAGALAVGAQHYDDQQPHVQVGGQNAKIVQYGSSRIPSNAMVLKGADGKMYRVWQQSGKGMNKMTLAAPAEQVKEGTVDRRIARTQALIQDYHKRAKASANDIKKNHYLAMADQLTAELQSLIDDASEHERAGNEIAQHDAEPSATWNRGGLGVAESQLNEYLVKAGMPVEDVLTLNLFQDFDPAEGCAAQFPEFAQDPTWKQVVRKYSRIANTLEKQILALDQPLTHSQAEEIEDVWYDGSDAYDDMEIKYLVDVYNRQIAVIEAIIAGELQDDDEEFGEGETQVNEFAPSNNDNGGEEDALFRFAQMWYSAPDIATQQKVEQALAKAGWEIGELESEEGGAYVMRVGDNEGDSYIGWSEEQLADISEGTTKTDDYVDPEEADYGDDYQAMVKRVGQKAKQQELAKKHNDEDLTESFLYAMKKAGYDII